MFLGVSVEAVEPRGQGPQQDLETGPSVLQVYSVYCNLWTVQTVWEPRLHGAFRCGQEDRQKQTGIVF